MESAGPIMQRAHDLWDETLTSLFAQQGPFLTLYLDTSPDRENAGLVIERRWRTARAEIDALPASVLDEIDEIVEGAHRDGSTLAIVATPAGVHIAESSPEPPRREMVRVGPLPDVIPLLEARQADIAHALVQIDRTGADITVAVPGRDAPIVREVGDASAKEVHKAGAGGWSMRRHHNRVEEQWERTADSVAAAITVQVERHGCRLVVVAGDLRAVGLLCDALPPAVRDIVKHVEGGRALDGSADAMAEDTTRMVATAAAEDTREVLRRWKDECGREGGHGIDGAAATLRALAEARVETLLVASDETSDDEAPTAWFGAEPNHVATDAATVHGYGSEEAVKARLVDVAVRAAAGTGAGVWIVPTGGGPSGGLGAIGRW